MLKSRKFINNLLFAIPLPCLVMGSLPIAVTQQKNHESIKNIKQTIEKNIIEDKINNSKANLSTNLKLATELLKIDSESSLVNEVVNEAIDLNYVEQRKDEVVDKIAATINTIGIYKGWSQEETKQHILDKTHAFLNSFNEFKNGMNNSKARSANNDKANNNLDLLGWINQTANDMGVDAFDSYMAQANIDNIENQYKAEINSYKNYSNSLKQNVISDMKSDLSNFLLQSKNAMVSQMEFDVNFANKLSSEQTFYSSVAPFANYSLSSYQKNAEDAQLYNVLTHFQKMYRDDLSLNDGGKNFVHHLKEFSNASDAYISSENKENVIKTEDLKELFNFKFDELSRTALIAPNFDYVNEDVTTLSLDNDNTTNLSDEFGLKTVAPMDTYETIGNQTYNVGEMYPGYTAHFRVLGGYDVDTNDSVVENFKVQIGVSDSVKDPEAKHILWASQQDSDTDDILNFDLSVTKFDDKKFIANNRYYIGQTAPLDSTKYNADLDEYYIDSKDQRPYLNEILDDKAPVDPETNEYIVDADHPLFLDENDVKGISLPKTIKGLDTDIWSNTHTNQKLQFKVTGCNTNIEGTHSLALYGNWAMVSNSPTEQNDGSEVSPVSVYDLPWSNSELTDANKPIWVSYQIDEELLGILHQATDVAQLFSSLCDKDNGVSKLIDKMQEKQSIEETKKLAKQYQILYILDSVTVALLAASIIATTAIMILTRDISLLQSIAFIGIAIAIQTTILMFHKNEYDTYEDSISKFDTLTNLNNNLKNNFSTTVLDKISEDYKKITNPKLKFSTKKDIAKEILGFVSSKVTDEGAIFSDEYNNLISDIFDTDQSLYDVEKHGLKQEWINSTKSYLDYSKYAPLVNGVIISTLALNVCCVIGVLCAFGSLVNIQINFLNCHLDTLGKTFDILEKTTDLHSDLQFYFSDFNRLRCFIKDHVEQSSWLMNRGWYEYELGFDPCEFEYSALYKDISPKDLQIAIFKKCCTFEGFSKECILASKSASIDCIILPILFAMSTIENISSTIVVIAEEIYSAAIY